MNEVRMILNAIESLKPTTVPVFALRSLQIVPNGYGEGDVLYGVPVPMLRKIAKGYRSSSLKTCEKLLQQPLHEARYTALVLLNEKFPKNSKEVLEVYLRNTEFINNWDLVDVSAPHIVGTFCLRTGNNGAILHLANRENFWENRIAVVATLPLIQSGQFALTLHLCERLLHHPHPLIHKACGWMLREIEKWKRERKRI